MADLILDPTKPMLLKPEHFDLARRLNEDQDFRANLEAGFASMADVEPDRYKKPHLYAAAQNKVMLDAWEKCGCNMSLLMPFFYPRYPKNRPMDMMERPFNMILLYTLVYHLTVLRGSRQIGKAQPYSEPVLTPKGWTTMGELKVGDQVFGRDGKPCRVTNIFEQGVRDVYSVEFTDDSSTRCDISHLWLIRRAGCINWKTETLDQIVERSGFTPKSDLAVRIPLTEPIQFPKRDHVITPYCMGALLGDGSLSQKAFLRFCTNDPEILENLLDGNEIQAVPTGSRGMDFYLRDPEIGKRSGMLAELDRLNLLGKQSQDKHIPEEYLFDSVDNRWELLRGLMDTDGTIYGKGVLEFTTSSPQLATGVAGLVKSLGGKVRLKTKRTGYKNKEGQNVECRTAYRIFPSRLPDNPFKLKRKADKFYQIRYKRTRTLKEVKKAGRERSRCIMVDSPDNTYITKDFIVTHNSVTIGTGQRLEAHLIDRLRSMYIAPHTDPLKTYARKFREVEKAFRGPKIPSKYKQNDYYKEYPNGSSIDLRKVQTSATTVRGTTIDVVKGDEMQIFDPSLETEMLEILNDSEIKSVLYAGTSTTLDTLLELRYQEGTQGVWQVMLPDGGTIDCGDPESIIPYIGPYQLQDPKTETKIDPLNGYYRFMNPAGFADRILSLHIPQIINPDIALKPLEWNGLYKTLKRDKTKFIQEKLGIPVAEADSEISEGDLKRICVLPFTADERKEKCRKGYYKMIVSGMDWGGSDENALTKSKISNTTHGILGVAPDDKVHILYMKRHGGKDYKTIINDIAMAHAQYCAGPLASDFGGGQVYNQILRGHPLIDASRHVIFDYDDPRATFIKAMKGDVSNAFLLNRTDSITSLYMAIVMQNPLILACDWDEFGDYLKDFLHMKRVLIENSKGGREFKYQRHASKTDDVVHVVNLAYTLIRMAGNMMLCEDPATRTLIRNAIYGGGYSGTGGDIGNPWSKALSDYARGGEYGDD